MLASIPWGRALTPWREAFIIKAQRSGGEHIETRVHRELTVSTGWNKKPGENPPFTPDC